jgi:hypothetical protein
MVSVSKNKYLVFQRNQQQRNLEQVRLLISDRIIHNFTNFAVVKLPRHHLIISYTYNVHKALASSRRIF